MRGAGTREKSVAKDWGRERPWNVLGPERRQVYLSTVVRWVGAR